MAGASESVGDMNNIVVIGAGQLGSRHLQGLAKLSQESTLHIVDPSENSIIEARERINEVSTCNAHEVISHNSVETLPDSIQLAIIATTADIRLSALNALCSHVSVQYLILEKVLFQKASDFKEAKKLIESNSIKCWVNCPRRAYPDYSDLKDFFGNEPLAFMCVHGGNWGLGCNAIHFLDLLAFFTGQRDFQFDTTYLDRESRVSRRSGFLEFSGSLMGDCTGVPFVLRSAFNSQAKHIISLHSESKIAVVDEVGSKVWKIDGQSSECVDFYMPFQSDLTTGVVESILTDGACSLTPYEESVLVHMPFLKALSTYLGHVDFDAEVPIT